MKLLEPVIINPKLSNCLGSKINHHVQNLNKFNQSENQKILELCQVGKFLCTYFPDFDIIESREQPDFLISNGSREYGLEHQSIFDDKILKRTGFFNNIALLAEREFVQDSSMPNFLVNCYIRKDVSFSNKEKNDILNTFLNVIKEFVFNNVIIENHLFDDIVKMPHSQKNIQVNFGAYMVPTLTIERLLKAIDKKERKVKKYINNTKRQQWLLLLIGGVGEQSYYLRKVMELNFDTSFEKVFLLEDFDNRLYELK